MSQLFKSYNEKDYLWRNYQVLNENANLENEIVERYKTLGDPAAFSSAKNIYYLLNASCVDQGRKDFPKLAVPLVYRTRISVKKGMKKRMD